MLPSVPAGPKSWAAWVAFGALCEIPRATNSRCWVSGLNWRWGTKLVWRWTLASTDTIGIDLVAMCVNDLVVCGAETRCSSSTITRTAKLEYRVAAQGCNRHRCGLRAGWLRTGRR